MTKMRNLGPITLAILTLMLTSSIAWATWVSVSSWKHETRITVTETEMKSVKDNVIEIRDGQKEMNRKLDRLIERR